MEDSGKRAVMSLRKAAFAMAPNPWHYVERVIQERDLYREALRRISDHPLSVAAAEAMRDIADEALNRETN